VLQPDDGGEVGRDRDMSLDALEADFAEILEPALGTFRAIHAEVGPVCVRNGCALGPTDEGQRS